MLKGTLCVESATLLGFGRFKFKAFACVAEFWLKEFICEAEFVEFSFEIWVCELWLKL